MKDLGITEPTPVRITRGRRAEPERGVFAIFDTSCGVLQVCLLPSRSIEWTGTLTAHGACTTQSGADLRWCFGRIVGHGPHARHFWDIKETLGLTLGQIEAELRDLTGYKEGTE